MKSEKLFCTAFEMTGFGCPAAQHDKTVLLRTTLTWTIDKRAKIQFICVKSKNVTSNSAVCPPYFACTGYAIF